MYNDSFEQWLKANKNFTAPLGEWNKLSTDLLRRISQENIEMMSDNFSRWSDQLKRFGDVKKPEDLINVLRECINENITATMENSQQLLHSTVEHMEECAKACGTLQEKTLKTAAKEKEREREL
jgi:hypothetical protein